MAKKSSITTLPYTGGATASKIGTHSGTATIKKASSAKKSSGLTNAQKSAFKAGHGPVSAKKAASIASTAQRATKKRAIRRTGVTTSPVSAGTKTSNKISKKLY